MFRPARSVGEAIPLQLIFAVADLICYGLRSLLFTFQKDLTYKYINFTIEQTGLYVLIQPSNRPIHNDMVRYYSVEHENLSYTALKAFQKNFLIIYLI